VLANKSIPRSTVIPELPYEHIGEAIDWLCNTFGFTLRIRIGDHRAQLNVGDGAVVLIEGLPQAAASRYAGSVMVRIEDVHKHHERSRQRGARILRPPQDYPYGERQYSVEDLGGHRWTFTQSIADVDPRDWGGTPGEL
jgi:uncharacterized glyoxalase superfamily protein PhnB